MALKEIYENGELVRIETIPDPEPVDEQLTVPKSAVTQLADDMSNPNINSISEVKAAMTNFLEKIK